MNLGTHIIKFPSQRWGFVGTLPIALGEVVAATIGDVLGCRTVGKDENGNSLAVKFPSFVTEQEARAHAANVGVALSN